MSKNTLVLDNPILINGKEVKELTYDPQEITAEQFSIACAKAASMEKTKTLTLKVKENDHALHMYLGMMAIIAVNPEIDVSDLERIKGFDILDVTNIGTFFILRRQAEPSEETRSGEPSETTVSTLTQASENSEG